ncbi:MAG TPA: carboxypeptidase regulatory-like domain-containing protein [Xanthobacteraceae bacterium]|nr:carboxypeptidase regulatory-like domain-containing protein [Xanthobacteraceae bacterium]
MRFRTTIWVFVTALMLALAGAIGGAAAQQQARQPALPQAQPAEPAKDYDQRSLEIFEFKKAAQSGPERGKEIYYYKCWICHNDLAEGGAPKLTGLFKRATLVTGAPMNDENVKNQIRNGSPNMGSYKYVLSDADLNDLLSWLHDEHCCWNPDAPPLNPRYKAADAAPAQSLYASLTGGPKGLVKNAKGDPIEGIMVQLISDKSAIRTTVFSHADGHYEFPKVAPGTYTLRIAKPLEFYPWVKDKVEIKGADTLEDITLLRVTPGEFLPPFPEIEAQLTGSEWLANLPGTGQDKKTLTVYCNFCHEYQQIFRNHYDEATWSKIIFRMTHGAGTPLINIRNPGRLTPAQEAQFAHFLSIARGPDSKDPNFVVQPRAQGRSTRVVITEYELPRLEIAAHDTAGDAKGRVWYSTHRSSYVGRLDPANGHVEEFHVPLPQPGAEPGTHWIYVDQKGQIWGSENWAHNIWTVDDDLKNFRRVHWNVQEPINSPMGGNYALDKEDNIWRVREGEVARISGVDGSKMEAIKTKKFASTYGSALSWDDRYFGGGAWPKDGMVIYDRQTKQLYEPDTSPDSGPARGEFDPSGNYWAAGRGGSLIKFDIKTKLVHEYPLPTPYTSLYTAKADKNGEVWAGELNGGHYLRFDPKTEQFTTYTLPEPFAMDRESWIDNSTNPVSVWFVDHDGWLVHIQPLD